MYNRLVQRYCCKVFAQSWITQQRILCTHSLLKYSNAVILCCRNTSWASYQIRKIAGAHALGMPGKFSPPPRASDPGMHHGTCVTHVPWCMPGSLTNDFLWSRRRGKTFPAFPAHAQTAILRIWQEAHWTGYVMSVTILCSNLKTVGNARRNMFFIQFLTSFEMVDYFLS